MIYITCKSLLRLFCCTPNINIASLYTAILLADVLTASDLREKLRHKGNPKNLLYLDKFNLYRSLIFEQKMTKLQNNGVIENRSGMKAPAAPALLSQKFNFVFFSEQ